MSSAYYPSADATDAVKFLDQASDHGDDSLRGLVLRHLAAMQGIGYGLLAIEERVGELLEVAAESRERLTGIAEAVAEAAPVPRLGLLDRLAWGLWGRRRFERSLKGAGYPALASPLTAADTPVLVQALADAASLRQGAAPGDCMDCIRAQADAGLSGQPDAAAGLARCQAHARHEHLSAAYAALRYRLLDGAS